MKIVHKEKTSRNLTPRYRIDVNFIHGMDGYDKKSIEFNIEDIKKYSGFILALATCNAAYPDGRSDYDDYFGLPAYDAFFAGYPDIYSECYDFLDLDNKYDDETSSKKIIKYLKSLNPNEISMEHPKEGISGCYSSFDGFSITYIDSEGDITDVDIIFNAEEQEKIEEAKKFTF